MLYIKKHSVTEKKKTCIKALNIFNKVHDFHYLITIILREINSHHTLPVKQKDNPNLNRFNLDLMMLRKQQVRTFNMNIYLLMP